MHQELGVRLLSEIVDDISMGERMILIISTQCKINIRPADLIHSWEYAYYSFLYV